MIDGIKVFLRPLRIEDWRTTIAWRNDLTFNLYIKSHPFPVTEELEQEWIKNVLEKKNNQSIYFAICSMSNKKIVGIANIYRINWVAQTCFFGLYIGSEADRQKGFGHETIQLILRYAFNNLNLRKISLEVIADNHAVLKIYSDIGFVKEGHLKEQFFAFNEYHDVVIMSIFRKQTTSA